MIVRVTTPTGAKVKTFEDIGEGNVWAQQILTVLGRGREFVPTQLPSGSQSIGSPMTMLELHDKGVSFFGAVDG